MTWRSRVLSAHSVRMPNIRWRGMGSCAWHLPTGPRMLWNWPPMVLVPLALLSYVMGVLWCLVVCACILQFVPGDVTASILGMHFVASD